MTTIAILTGNHLCHNPRVIKEATALAASGYEVRVLGAWFDPALAKRDRELLSGAAFKFEAVLDLTCVGAAGRWRRDYYRARSKAALWAFRLFGVESGQQLGYAAQPLRAAAFGLAGDLFIAHSEVAMVVARDLLRSGRTVGIDMEDWYSRDLSPEAQAARPLELLRRLERELLQHARHITCPSKAMSDALAREYGCRPPVVVYNAFPWSERESLDCRALDRPDRSTPSLHWMSQTLGSGRGLEDLAAALPLVRKPMQIHFRGRPAAGFEAWLRSRIPEQWRSSVFFHDLVPNAQLPSRIAEHDIGFAGELRSPDSKDLTVPNKVLQYLQAGLAVVASDTRGQREIAAQAPGAVLLFRPGEPEDLARSLNALLEDPAGLAAARAAALKAAEEVFAWEKCQRALLDSVADALLRGAVPAASSAR